MPAPTAFLDIENAIFSTFDNLSQAIQNGSKQDTLATINAFTNVLNAGISATGLVGQFGAYVAGGGTAAAAAPFFARLNGVGLATDFAVSVIGIGVAYNAYAA